MPLRVTSIAASMSAGVLPGPPGSSRPISRSGWLGRADGQPAHAAEVDVVAHLEAEDVAVERQRGVLVVDGEEAVGDGEFHGVEPAGARPGRFSKPAQCRSGRLSCLAKQAGTAASARWSRAR